MNVKHAKETKKHKNRMKSKSKFAAKYNDRIQSIKESDEKALKRKQARLKENKKKETVQEEVKKRGRGRPRKVQ